MYKYLKDKQYYIDLYGKNTVEHCRRTEEYFKNKDLPPIDGEKLSKEKAERMKKSLVEYFIHFEAGERYLKKEETIQGWMEADKTRDDLLENAQAPENIRCLSCRNVMKPTFKDLRIELDKPDRVLFMYDCPNKCLPRRAFFNDGEEWRTKPDLCPNCMAELSRKNINSDEKLVTKYSCPGCKYTNTEEYKWTYKEEEPYDENFARDRDRFCLTDEDGEKYRQEKWQLERMGKFVEEWKEIEKAREEKLKQNPKGFHLEGVGYTCFICGDSTSEGDNWYDQYGIKCLVCQKAIDEGEIPATLASDKESWYSKFELDYYFNVNHHTLRKWKKEGIIKARTVSYYGDGVHTELFLLEDNKDFLPPKKLVESQSVSEIRDGKTWHSTEKWYRFVDPFKHLKRYKIMKYMRVVPPEEMKAREEAEKEKQEKRQAKHNRLKK